MLSVEKGEANAPPCRTGAAEKQSMAENAGSSPGSRKNTAKPLLLTYHEVWPEETNYLYSVSCKRFEEHLQLIGEIQRATGSAVPRLRVCFDDGHVSNYEHALPLLEQCAVKAVFFVTAGFTGTREGFMDWGQLRELVSLGHEVQSHGWSHAHLTECSEAELKDELVRSRQTLEDKLGIVVDALSFPGGRWDERVLDACAQAGYRRVYGSKPWLRAGRGEALELHGRLMVRRTMRTRQMAQLIQGSGAAMLRLRAQGVLVEAAKKILGDGGYLTLWRILARKQAEK